MRARYPCKVVFVVPSLAGGGAERVVVTLLQHIDRQRFAPSLVLFQEDGAFRTEVPGDVAVFDLGKRSRRDFVKLVLRLAHVLECIKPDVSVGFLTYANIALLIAKMLCRSKSKPAIVCTEHNTFSFTIGRERLGWLKTVLVRYLYPQAEKVVFVSHGDLEDFGQHVCLLRKDQVNVIPNPQPIESIRRKGLCDPEEQLPDRPRLISVGRLEEQKGYPYLLRAFKLVLQEFPSASLMILGEGSLQSALHRLAQDLGISERVRFLGFKKNPYCYMTRSDVFILPSLWEGFGNVIIEAMACGVPVVSTDCSGPREIIQQGVNGLLVPAGDPERLAKAILCILKNPLLANNLKEAGIKRAWEYDVSRVVPAYEALLMLYHAEQVP